MSHTPSSILATLQAHDWSQPIEEATLRHFRQLLYDLEQTTGITPAHHFFSNQMLAQGAKLKHDDMQQIDSPRHFAISPDGRYFALATCAGDDHYNDGAIQIWEVETGRCVNNLKEKYGGIGWIDKSFCMQWSPDSRYIGASIFTNCVAKFDPFSSNYKPLVFADITNGHPRPPAWCWTADGKHLFIAHWAGENKIACLVKAHYTWSVEFDDGEWFSEATLQLDNFPELAKEEYLNPYDWCAISQDGKIAYGHDDEKNQVYALEIASKCMIWFKKIDFRKLYWSKNGHYFASNYWKGKVNFYTSHNGKLVQSIEHKGKGINFLCFSPHSPDRFAILQNKTVTIYDSWQATHSFQLNASIHSYYLHHNDFTRVIFSLDGSKMAILTDNSEVEIWSIDPEPQRISSFKTFASGIYWGTNDRIVTFCMGFIDFRDINGNIIHEFSKSRQEKVFNSIYPDQPSPLKFGRKNFARQFPLNPVYPFQATKESEPEWLVAFETGLVVSTCTDSLILDRHLSLVWDNRLAWPYRWMEPIVYPSLFLAKSDPKFPFPQRIHHLFTADHPKRNQICFEKQGSNKDMIQFYFDSAKELKNAYHHAIDEQMPAMCCLLLKVFDDDANAFEIVNSCHDVGQYLNTLGNLATQLLQKGQNNKAQRALELAETTILDCSDDEYDQTVLANLVAPYYLMGNQEKANDYLNKVEAALRAKAKEDKWVNFDAHGDLCKAYYYIGQKDKAIAAFMTGLKDYSSMHFALRPTLFYFIDNDDFDFFEQIYLKCLEKNNQFSSFEVMHKIVDYHLEKGAWQTALAWLDRLSLHTFKCEIRVLEYAVTQGQQKKVAEHIIPIINKLETDQEPLWKIVDYLPTLSLADPIFIQTYLKKAAIRLEKAFGSEEYFIKIAQTCANAGYLPPSLIKYVLTYRSKKEIALFLLHLIYQSRLEQDIKTEYYKKALAIIPSIDKEEERIPLYLQLALIAEEWQQIEAHQVHLQMAHELAKQNNHYEDLWPFYLKRQQFEQAYQAFRKYYPRERYDNMAKLLIPMIKEGYWQTAIDIARTVPANDINYRHRIVENLVFYQNYFRDRY